MELLRPLSDADFPAKNATYTGTAGVTGTWNAGPQGVVVWSDQPCYIAVGVGVTATVNSTPIPPFTPIPFYVESPSGASWRVSALQLSNAGTVYCKPINIR